MHHTAHLHSGASATRHSDTMSGALSGHSLSGMAQRREEAAAAAAAALASTKSGTEIERIMAKIEQACVDTIQN